MPQSISAIITETASSFLDTQSVAVSSFLTVRWGLCAESMHALNMPLKPPLDGLLFQGSSLCKIPRNILTSVLRIALRSILKSPLREAWRMESHRQEWSWRTKSGKWKSSGETGCASDCDVSKREACTVCTMTCGTTNYNSCQRDPACWIKQTL